MITQKQFDEIEFGQTMCCITGPGQFPEPGGCEMTGSIVAKRETRFAREFEIKVLGGGIEYATSAHNPQDHKGIGWYLVEQC